MVAEATRRKLPDGNSAILFQLTNDEISSLAMGQKVFYTDTKQARSIIDRFVFLTIELQEESWLRTDLAAIKGDFIEYVFSVAAHRPTP